MYFSNMRVYVFVVQLRESHGSADGLIFSSDIASNNDFISVSIGLGPIRGKLFGRVVGNGLGKYTTNGD